MGREITGLLHDFGDRLRRKFFPAVGVTDGLYNQLADEMPAGFEETVRLSKKIDSSNNLITAFGVLGDMVGMKAARDYAVGEAVDGTCWWLASVTASLISSMIANQTVARQKVAITAVIDGARAVPDFSGTSISKNESQKLWLDSAANVPFSLLADDKSLLFWARILMQSGNLITIGPGMGPSALIGGTLIALQSLVVAPWYRSFQRKWTGGMNSRSELLGRNRGITSEELKEVKKNMGLRTLIPSLLNLISATAEVSPLALAVLLGPPEMAMVAGAQTSGGMLRKLVGVLGMGRVVIDQAELGREYLEQVLATLKQLPWLVGKRAYRQFQKENIVEWPTMVKPMSANHRGVRFCNFSPRRFDGEEITPSINGTVIWREGECLVIKGPNGAGKTSMGVALKAMSRFGRGGVRFWDGKGWLDPLEYGSVQERDEDFGMSAEKVWQTQNHFSFFEIVVNNEWVKMAVEALGIQVGEDLIRQIEIRKWNQSPKTMVEAVIVTELKQLVLRMVREIGMFSNRSDNELMQLLLKPVSQASTGEQTRLRVLKEAFGNQRVVIIDEPTIGLNQEQFNGESSSFDEMKNLLKWLLDMGKTVVLITNETEDGLDKWLGSMVGPVLTLDPEKKRILINGLGLDEEETTVELDHDFYTELEGLGSVEEIQELFKKYRLDTLVLGLARSANRGELRAGEKLMEVFDKIYSGVDGGWENRHTRGSLSLYFGQIVAPIIESWNEEMKYLAWEQIGDMEQLVEIDYVKVDPEREKRLGRVAVGLAVWWVYGQGVAINKETYGHEKLNQILDQYEGVCLWLSTMCPDLETKHKFYHASSAFFSRVKSYAMRRAPFLAPVGGGCPWRQLVNVRLQELDDRNELESGHTCSGYKPPEPNVW